MVNGYSAILAELFSLSSTRGMKLGLHNMQELVRLCGLDIGKIPTIHIAGTNGKGSVSTKIAAALELEGYRVGLYTSPHVATFRERIRINKQMISEESVVRLLKNIFQHALIAKLQPTFFEVTTALAFAYFLEEDVDYFVLETGLGGRLDATNICTPILSIITSISFDHTALLGNTLEAIAREKAGIIKRGVDVVTGPRVPKEVIDQVSLELSARHIRVDGNYDDYEEENRAVATKALEVLGRKIPLSHLSIERGLDALPSCRLEHVPRDLVRHRFPDADVTAIILDVAHNPDGFDKVFKRIRAKYPNAAIALVLGMSQDKDIDECLSIALPQIDALYAIQADAPRALLPEKLKERAEQLSNRVPCRAMASIDDAIAEAIKAMTPVKGIVLIAGTFFIMRQSRKALGYIEEADSIDVGAFNHIALAG